MLRSKAVLPNCLSKGERGGVSKEAPPRKHAVFHLWSTYLLGTRSNWITWCHCLGLLLIAKQSINSSTWFESVTKGNPPCNKSLASTLRACTKANTIFVREAMGWRNTCLLLYPLRQVQSNSYRCRSTHAKQYLGLYQHLLQTRMSQTIKKQQVNQRESETLILVWPSAARRSYFVSRLPYKVVRQPKVEFLTYLRSR